MKKAAFYTLGCKVNQQDSEALAGLFEDKGYQIVDVKEIADVYVINTCTVTHMGDRKSRQMVRKAVKGNKEAKIIVTGCYAQTSPGEVLAIPGVDMVIGTKDRQNIVKLIEELPKKDQPLNLVADIMAAREFEELPVPVSSRTRAFIKVQEGCNQFCTYCIVPYARGPIRSRPLDRVVREVVELVAKGYQEVVLTGTHTGMYGRDLPKTAGPITLAKLIAALVEINGLQRLRISSVDPNDFSDELIEILVESPIVCPHFHIPLQSGDDQVLKKMKRPYTTGEYGKLVARLRQKNQEVAFTTDVMVGFPGETEQQFQNTVDFIERVGFCDLHVFKYSPRKGTPAAEFDNQVAPEIKENRSRMLHKLTNKLQEKYCSNFINEVRKVLVEKIWQQEKGKTTLDQELSEEQVFWEGLTDNYLRVIFAGERQLVKGLIPVRLLDWQDGYMTGKPLD